MISTQELGRRIAAQRKRRGVRQAELAAQLGLARTTVVAIEKGQRRPSDSELVAIARALSVPLNELIREHFVSGDVAPRFRIGPGKGPATTEVAQAVDQVVSLARRFVELERLLGMTRVATPLESLHAFRVETGAEVDPRVSGEEAALTVRNLIGFGDGPALDLEDRLATAAGLRIFHPELPTKVAGFFFWSEELGACVALNRHHPAERRRWTLAHELGHFLRDREKGEVLELTPARRGDPSEVFAEAFTASFLLPGSGVSRSFSQRRRDNAGRFTPADIVNLAHGYGVSFQAMTLRLEELALLRPGTYQRITGGGLKVGEAERAAGIVRPTSREPSLLPERYVLLALTAYEKELLSEGELAMYLQCDRVAARRLHQQYRQQQGHDLSAVELDLGSDLLRTARPSSP